LDEIHRLQNPSEILKIAADHFHKIKILATGSSTLSASDKFRDTLTGRKVEIWLTPMNLADMQEFNSIELENRFLKGGLPSFFLQKKRDDSQYQEWFDSFWAKDVQELFRLERRSSFQRLMELLLLNSGGIFEATKYASACEASRPTIQNYLTVLEMTHIAQIIRPYNTHKSSEILSAPKVYGFDTGFVCVFRGWDSLRASDKGNLWEHFVLNEIQSHIGYGKVKYWRNKSGHEIDFIIEGKRGAVHAIECKWKAGDLDASALSSFRAIYPIGKNYIVTSDTKESYRAKRKNLILDFVSLPELIQNIS